MLLSDPLVCKDSGYIPMKVGNTIMCDSLCNKPPQLSSKTALSQFQDLAPEAAVPEQPVQEQMTGFTCQLAANI